MLFRILVRVPGGKKVLYVKAESMLVAISIVQEVGKEVSLVVLSARVLADEVLDEFSVLT